MQGFLKDMIFTRYLGAPNILDGTQWKDCNQCYICDKWDKVDIGFVEEDAVRDIEFEQVMKIAEAEREHKAKTESQKQF
jgi:hypothetical protein